ncbi:anti-sigma factor family protein [Plebeiibacterium sediminum]|uniref:Zf-HC2 domain-containing protein n=1 Tax=Plebeiibacterium sediminum TaxID=2992112 RepID=A0AAE3M3L1_9BACT|nr:zf-HC2 domain-containing protein [Plebeiobacterium sediminum]MCW3786611.1 zf-HC2 domain-containing protein [Plebeiobacterium sediminum]
MKCIEEEAIQKYIDWETSKEESINIESHIATCNDCKQKYLEQKQICNDFTHSLNALYDQKTEVPEFKYPESPKRSLKSTYKKLVYTISAASIIAFTYFYSINTNTGQIENMYLNSYDEVFDANKSIDQQGIMITITDSDGHTTEFNLN